MAEEKTPTVSKKQAEEAGWKIAHVQKPRAIKTGITGGGSTELLIEDEVWRAEKTYNDHLITAQAPSEELLWEQIASQEASLAGAIQPPPTLGNFNDHAGDAGGDKNVGVGGILEETAVEKPEHVRRLEEELAEDKDERSKAVTG